jgi:hypothetical protein
MANEDSNQPAVDQNRESYADDAKARRVLNVLDDGTPVDALNPLPVDAGSLSGSVTLKDGDGATLADIETDGTKNALYVQANDLDIRDLASGSDSVAAVQSGTWNITNVSGTISLPTGAATSALQLPDGHNVTVDNASLVVTATDLDIRDLTSASDDVSVTTIKPDGTNTMPSLDAVGRAGFVKITDGTNTASVNTDGQIHTVLRGKIDTNNSTSSNLGAGAAFTGTATDTLDYSSLSFMVYSDVASATDGFDIQYSTDGSTDWHSGEKYTIIAGATKFFTPTLQNRYMRIVYTNGAAPQGDFHIHAILRKVPMKPSSHNIDDPIMDEDDAELVKAVITGKKANGIYDNVSLTNGGNMKVSLEEMDSGALGQDTMANSLPVVIASDQSDISIDDGGNSITVDGTFWQATQPVSIAQDVMLGTDFSNVLGAASLILATQADDIANTVDGLQTSSFGYVFDGTTWDRMRGTSADGVLVNLGANNDVTITSGTVTTITNNVNVNLQDGSGTDITSSGGALDVNLASSDITITANIEGDYVDDATFTVASDRGLAVGGVFTTDTIDANDFGAFKINSKREQFVVQDTAGNLNMTEVNSGTIAGDTTSIDGKITACNTGAVVISSGTVTTITNDVNIADGGNSITVDQGTHDNFNANANIQVADTDASTSNPVPIKHSITGIGDGVKTVTSAGTDVVLAGSTACKRVTIQAQTDNTGLIAVGATGVDATEATGTGIILFPGDYFEFEIDNLADVFIDSTVSGEGVRFTYFT